MAGTGDWLDEIKKETSHIWRGYDAGWKGICEFLDQDAIKWHCLRVTALITFSISRMVLEDPDEVLSHAPTAADKAIVAFVMRGGEVVMRTHREDTVTYYETWTANEDKDAKEAPVCIISTTVDDAHLDEPGTGGRTDIVAAASEYIKRHIGMNDVPIGKLSQDLRTWFTSPRLNPFASASRRGQHTVSNKTAVDPIGTLHATQIKHTCE